MPVGDVGEVGPLGEAAAFRRYVAIGDSQTEGLLDPDGYGGLRGWADRFAEFVSASGNPALEYANLAVRGRRLGLMRAEQLEPAQAMQPDLVTVMGGLNDLLQPSFDPTVALGHLEAMLAGFPAATVLTNTFPDPGAISPLLGRAAGRVESFNAGIREVAARNGALVVDFAARGVGTDACIWSPDRIHATPVGHALMAAAFADTLGLSGFGGWDEPFPPDATGAAARAAGEAAWAARFVVPRLYRGLRGRSSGDGATAKRPALSPVASIFHLVEPDVWAAAGTTYRAPSLAVEGFTHLSFAHQVAGSANRHCAEAHELVAVEIEAGRAGARVVVEDSYGSGTAFPHLYGPLPRAAVTAVHPMTRDSGGAWMFDAVGVGRGLSAACAAARPSPDR